VSRGFASRGALLTVLLAVVLIGVVRLRVGAIPLERDEGEYAYAGQLILQGVPPYELAFNMKFPGTYYAYALILAIFGESPLGIHAGLLIVNAATTFLVFTIGRRLAGDAFGAFAAVSFAVLSVDRPVLGVFAHATHFVLVPALGALLLLTRDRASRRLRHVFGSGVLLGIAVLMKQHAVFFVPLAAGLLVSHEREEGSAPHALGVALGAQALGMVLPFAAMVALFLAQGVLGSFWFWTVRYAAAYVTEVPASRALSLFGAAWTYITLNTRPFWIAAAAGLVALWATPWSLRARVFITGLLAASFLAICPGFYFRPHYFILLLPAIAFLVGAAVVALVRLLERIVSPVASLALGASVFAAVVASYAWTEREYLFTMTPREVSRSIYAAQPFVEAPEIARYIRERTAESDRIAVLGSEPEIFFYAGRLSATGYVYTYPLVEIQPFAARMQEEMIRQLRSADPKYLVFVEIDESWLVAPGSDSRIVDWGNRYAHECFDLVGIADIYSPTDTKVLWDDEVRGYRPISPNVVYTFRKKDDTPCTIMP
jgi:4-amino-4-deoxy-L-arabinose transferase-like glycosyltransferase